MTVKIADSVVETTQTTGTGTLDLDGAQTGYRAFADELTSGDQVYYCIEDDPSSPTAYEIGIGTWTSGSPNTLSRDTVLKSSNAGAKVSLAAGGYTVTGVLPAEAFGDVAALGIGDGLENDGSGNLRAKIVSAGGIGRSASGLSLDISGMTEETSVDATADFVPLYDASGTVIRKVKPQNLLPAATQAQMEAASSNVVAVTPLNAKWHPGIAKAWVVFDGTPTGAYPLALSAAAHNGNLSAITKNGTGDYTITWSVAFSSVNYSYMISAEASSGANVGVHQVRNGGKAAGSLRIQTFNASAAAADFPSISVIAFGDL